MATKKQQAEYRKSQAKSKLAWGIAFFFAIVWLVIALVPFLFMILNSFRKQFDMLSQGVFHLPDPWYFENYSNVVANGFFGYFFRSVIVVAISLVLMLMISAFAAYPLSRMKFRFRNLIYAGVVAMMAHARHLDSHFQDDHQHGSVRHPLVPDRPLCDFRLAHVGVYPNGFYVHHP